MARVVMSPGWEAKITAAAQPIVHELAEDIAEDTRRSAPVDTGRLKASIEADGNRVNIGGGDVDYAVYVEFGTRNMAAQPFIRPNAYKYRTP